MGYYKALEVLPEELVRQIQEYVDGQIIYIPRLKDKRCKWGENTDTKDCLKKRNCEIYERYLKGMTILELSGKYFLDPKSIQRILRNIQSI